MIDNTPNAKPVEPAHLPQVKEPVLHLGSLVSPAVGPPGADESLTGFMAKAVADTVEHSAKPVVVPNEGGSIPPQALLGVVSYCYAKGVYASEDIGRELVSDPAVREAAHGDVPRPEDIRRFRRLNRDAIQATVEKALAFARRKVVETLSPPNPFRGHTDSSSATPIEALPVDARREDSENFTRRDASARLDKATFIDGMSM